MDISFLTAHWQNLALYSLSMMAIGWAIGARITFKQDQAIARASGVSLGGR